MANMRVWDRSRATTDWQCPRKRYWGYEYLGRGITTTAGGSNLELFMGTTIHDSLAVLASQQVNGTVDIDAIAVAARAQMYSTLTPALAGEIGADDFIAEQATLVEGLVRGFYRHVWPKLLADYPTILSIEEEMRFDYEGLTFMSKPDIILANDRRETVYVEYKSTSSKREGWINSWDTAIQIHSALAAIKATKDLDVDKVIVQGLYKGYESYGKQSSPFCYAYRRQGNPPFSQTETLYSYRAGFKRYPTWELPGGVAKWVAEMPHDILAEQFPQTPPIFVKDHMVKAFFAQRLYREKEIELATVMLADKGLDEQGRENVLHVAFPQRFDQCQPAYGKPCTFRQLCHGHVENPLETGRWQPREPHHELEVEMFEEAK